jgi:osmoprotectant transport system substrate-binding protein
MLEHRLRFFAGLLASSLLLGFAASSHAQTIRVGSKNFTEQFIVAEIYAQALENAGIKSQTRINLGATLIAHAALLHGDIDLYPEYTGTAMAHVVKGDLSGSAEQTYAAVKGYYEKNLHLTLLQPTHIDNGYAIVVLPETALKYKLKTLSDLGPASQALIFGAEGSFADRTDGLPGMSRVYGIHFKDFRNLAKLGIRYSALTSRNIDVSFGFTTDWQIADEKLVVLDDDKHLFPPYFLVPVIRQDTLARNPRVAGILNAVSALLTSDDMRAMNASVERDREEPMDVAGRFLKQKGLLK